MNDPVCGMTVTAETATALEEWDGTTFGFCSDYCHETFSADPDKIITMARDTFPHIFSDQARHEVHSGHSVQHPEEHQPVSPRTQPGHRPAQAVGMTAPIQVADATLDGRMHVGWRQA